MTLQPAPNMPVCFTATPAWRSAFPGSRAAVLAVHGVANPITSDALDVAKRALESRLRDRWVGKTRADIRADPVLAVYDAFDRRFNQNYHVQMQIESIALKGKSIPSRAALVEAMFMAEMETGMLTAVHDLDALVGGVTVDLATGDEAYVRYDGVTERCKPGDQYMRDGAGVLTSITQGPTTLGRVTAVTTNALFCVYAPAGIERAMLEHHLDTLAGNVRLIVSSARISNAIILEAE